MDDALRVREFWFGKRWTGPLESPLSSEAGVESLEERVGLWFGDDSALRRQQDEAMRLQFSKLLDRAALGELASWADSPRRRLSLILLLDQFPRQMYRGTARAFVYDGQALSLALSGMQSAADGALNVVERMFFYMPLQHAESLEVQDESVAAYGRLLSDAPPQIRATFADAFQSAESHRSLIQRFGRFPHRNAILGRDTTPEERVFLDSSGNTFGQ
jgi:uncharacterized protein (DUF924 family)